MNDNQADSVPGSSYCLAALIAQNEVFHSVMFPGDDKRRIVSWRW